MLEKAPSGEETIVEEFNGFRFCIYIFSVNMSESEEECNSSEDGDSNQTLLGKRIVIKWQKVLQENQNRK